MLSRKVITRRGRRFRGYFPSQKLGRMVAWESLLELQAILLLEFSWGVASYKEQPVLVQYFEGEKARDYYPDFEVVLASGEIVHVEVKPATKLEKPDIKAKFVAIATHYRNQRKQAFRIVTESELEREPLLSNVKTLAYLAGRSGDSLPKPQELIKSLGSEPMPFRVMEAALGRETVLRLLSQGMATCDLTQVLAGDTLVALGKGERHATYLL